ncbi:hypothetical protein [Helicobacter pylori]|uniref:hypothetical protein n=1 Tax=Helicobacter pylori TaxID=210 RepID=UPI0039E089B9
MKQKVHSVSYLAKAEFDLKNGVYDLVALPTGAEVVKVSLEVIDIPVEGHIYIGFKDEPVKGYFLALDNVIQNPKAPEAPIEHVVNTITSTKDYTATSNKVVVAEVKLAKDLKERCVLRVVYFLPSVIEVEY